MDPFNGTPAPVQNQKILVIGMGMAGLAFVEKLLAYSKEMNTWSITVVGEEHWMAYNRVGLSQYLTHQSAESLYLQPTTWYSSHQPGQLTYFTGDPVIKVKTDEQRAFTKSGLEITYDLCVFATGSQAALPSYVSPGEFSHTRGLFVYRTIDDLAKIKSFSEQLSVTRVAVIGGGLLGLEVAKAVSDLRFGIHVTILERNKWVLSRQLDENAGRMVMAQVKALGIDIILDVTVQSLLTKIEHGLKSVSGLRLQSGAELSFDMVILAVGIKPRDELAQQAGIEAFSKGGIVIQDDLRTSNPHVFAIGECASWKGNTYGFIGPCVAMAEILAFNLTRGLSQKAMNFTAPDTSTRLKLVGINMACFGDHFADIKGNSTVPSHQDRTGLSSPRSLSFHDPFGSVYKKYTFSGDGNFLLGGMMVGDIGDYFKLVSIVQKNKPLDTLPNQLILGVQRKEDEFDGDDLDNTAQVCSCYNVSKSTISQCVLEGCTSIGEVKSKTKATSGCGGCAPLVASIFNSSMKKAGMAVTNYICSHFKRSRRDLFMIVQIKQLKTLAEIMQEAGESANSVGCEVCKPAVASILASLHNEFIMKPVHHQNQDTNDKYLANIQRNGTYSVIPRVPAGEITPAKLKALAIVADKYGLYTKITGAQRIDLFGANKQDLPDIWEDLGLAGFESGHAYGKALRTVKSCVGTTWCRFGVGDSVGLALELEERYKGIRAPHKIKGAASGCVRECAEAQGKDFGVIATSKGWNVYIGGNGGAKPRHAELLAVDVSREKAIKLIDRFLMLYIRSADRLQRTARWVESLAEEKGVNGLEYLKSVIIDDSLGICDDLDKSMDALVGTFFDEWAEVVKNPEKRSLFRQFSNTDEIKIGSEMIEERGQRRPANWLEDEPSLKFSANDVVSENWIWRKVSTLKDLRPTNQGSSSMVINYSDTQIAVFRLSDGKLYASQQLCPHRRAFVLSDGLLGETSEGRTYISCPLHKRNFALIDGTCISDDKYKIMTFEIKEDNGDLFVKLPEPQAIDKVLGTKKWIKQVEGKSTKQELNHVEIAGTSESQTKSSIGLGPNNMQVQDGVSCLSARKELEW